MKNRARRIAKFPWMGKLFRFIPYSFRPGIFSSYRAEQKRLLEVENLSESEKLTWSVVEFRKAAIFAYENSRFYRKLYDDSNINVYEISSYEDIEKLPIVTKEMLRDIDPDDAVSCRELKSQRANTGGSSGSPLEFRISSNQIGVEWSNLHFFYEKWGLDWRTTRICFVGQKTLADEFDYDAVRDAYFINVYQPVINQVATVVKILSYNSSKKFLFHGYPSLIKSLVDFLDRDSSTLISSKVDNVLFCSEFAPQILRREIEEKLKVRTYCFYGHSERACIAYEKFDSNYSYIPSVSYGFTECVDGELVATSFHNYSFPFVRYATGDSIRVNKCIDGLVREFIFDEGRRSDFIADIDGDFIQLTALIFGRHHPAFNYLRSLQVYQPKPGYATLYLTPKPEVLAKNIESSWFKDKFVLDDVKVRFDLRIVSSPILSRHGKLLLKLDNSSCFDDLSQV
jgi:phenylacetate-CoA ligase